MRKITLFLKMSYKRKALFTTAFILTGIMRLAIIVVPFRIIAKVFLQPVNMPNNRPQQPIQHLRRAHIIGKCVATVAKYTPWQSKCLVQGLVCRILLRALKIPSVFYLGVNIDKESTFTAHAWMSCNEMIIIGGTNSPEQFKIISEFRDNIT